MGKAHCTFCDDWNPDDPCEGVEVLTRAEREDLLRRARDMGYDAGLWGKARPDIATLLEGLDREDTD